MSRMDSLWCTNNNTEEIVRNGKEENLARYEVMYAT